MATRSDLSGQVALVTGAGRGIGRAVAAELAAAGAAVALVARSADQVAAAAAAIHLSGGTALGLAADVTSQADVNRVVREVEQRLGPVDLLVNNAGIYGPRGPLWETDPAAWWEVLEVNLFGTVLCTRTVLPAMVARGRGRIINLASNIGNKAAPYSTAYSCSKAAVMRLTDSLALSLRPNGISVFAISPGLVRTELSAPLWEAMETGAGAEWLERPLARDDWGGADRAGRLVALLASGQADLLSGRYIHVSEDVAALVKRAGEIEQADLYTLRLRT